MSKEKRNQKRRQQAQQRSDAPDSIATQADKRSLTVEEKAEIIKKRLANRPVLVFRYPNGKWNLRFIVTLAILIIGLIVSIYFMSHG